MKGNPLKWRTFSLKSSLICAGMFFFGCLSEPLIHSLFLRAAIAMIGTIGLIVIRLISVPMWRCPNCGKGLPRRGMMEWIEDDDIVCPHCLTWFYEEE